MCCVKTVKIPVSGHEMYQRLGKDETPGSNPGLGFFRWFHSRESSVEVKRIRCERTLGRDDSGTEWCGIRDPKQERAPDRLA
ncbi:hypothetical protein SAMN04487946_101604 [Halobellus clavatus]|uniref:Uncharacterized protein n=1 Tax=Halobellus clavatus TaxID=660517 RepID=A0A1H3DIZ6_9EURY|nr:hypothetical protein SAMN04487946_101604 [Halobellus clavatus]